MLSSSSTPTSSPASPLSWPAVTDTSEQARQLIASLPENEKIQVAVQRIIAGYAIYFTCGHAHSQSPYPLKICRDVIKQLNANGYQVTKQEDYDDGSSIYGPEMRGYLDGIWVSLKKESTTTKS